MFLQNANVAKRIDEAGGNCVENMKSETVVLTTHFFRHTTLFNKQRTACNFVSRRATYVPGQALEGKVTLVLCKGRLGVGKLCTLEAKVTDDQDGRQRKTETSETTGDGGSHEATGVPETTIFFVNKGSVTFCFETQLPKRRRKARGIQNRGLIFGF